MTCDTCNQQFNYCFYINDEFWRKVVGEDRFKNSQGRICAHCTLEALGGLDWYVIHNEPTENINREQRRACGFDNCRHDFAVAESEMRKEMSDQVPSKSQGEAELLPSEPAPEKMYAGIWRSGTIAEWIPGFRKTSEDDVEYTRAARPARSG